MSTLLLIAALAIECALPEQLESPPVGAVLETQVENFVAYEEIVAVDSEGLISTRWYISDGFNAPIESRRGYETIRRSFLGILSLGTLSETTLSVSTSDILDRLRSLRPGEEATFDATLPHREGARTNTRQGTVRIRFNGCETIATNFGNVETLSYVVERPHVDTSGLFNSVQTTTTQFYYAPSIGWPVRVMDAAGSLELTAIHR